MRYKKKITMKSIRVKNLHCISDTKEIPLKGINLFVGANSTGKSSVLRLFPLLKQSLDVKKRGPLLWYGEDVDFGTFKNTCKLGESFIQLEFCLDLEFIGFKRRKYFTRGAGGSKSGTYCTSIKIESKEKNDYISELTISFEDQVLQIMLNERNLIDKITINKTDYSLYKDDMTVVPWGGGLVPRIEFVKKTDDHYSIINGYIPKQLSTIISNNCESRVGGNTMNSIAYSIECGSKKDILNSALLQKKPISWGNSMKKWSLETPDFIKFNDLILLQNIPLLISYVDAKLNEFIKNIHYIGPFRATAQRYYRKQNLSVTEIDSQGFNFPMFIDNLPISQQDKFRSWLIDKFNFYIEPFSSEGHISLMLVDAGSEERFNLADRGFGFSQLLPIITMLWTLETSPHRLFSKSVIFAIEQPELHLHPLLQAKLADAFMASVNIFKEEGIDFKLILETHSPTIVNRIGAKILETEFSADNVTIALFNDSHDSKEPIKLAHYNELGYLENWPIGFFDI